jgi:hypothetical protein
MRRLSNQPYPRLGGAVLLAVLTLACLVYLTSLYAQATREHVEIAFYQEGLSSGGLLQIYVDCAGPYDSGSPPTSGIEDLGWLTPGELVTVQARFGGAGVYLRYRLIVDGRQQAVYASRGEPGNQQTGTPGRWLVHRTYSAAGGEVVHAGCDTTGVKPALALADPTLRGGAWYEWAFTAATASAPGFLWLYYAAGVAIILAVVVAQALARALKSRQLWPLIVAFPGIILGIATAAHELELHWLKGVIAGATALTSAIVATWWLRHDIARAGQALRRGASMLLPTDPPKQQ